MDGGGWTCQALLCSSATGVAGATVKEGASEPIKVSKWRCITLRRLEDAQCGLLLSLPRLSVAAANPRSDNGSQWDLQVLFDGTCNSTLFHVLNPMNVFFFHLHTQPRHFLLPCTATATNTFLPCVPN